MNYSKVSERGSLNRKFYPGTPVLNSYKMPLYKSIAMLPGMATVYDDADLCIIKNSAAGTGSGDI